MSIIYYSLKLTQVLLIPVFITYLVYYLIKYSDTKVLLNKALSFLITVTLVIGFPLGLIKLAYPKEVKDFEKKLEASLAKGEE